MKNTVSAIHPKASAGYTTAAGNYVRGRPDYPPEIADWLRDSFGMGPGMTVVDLGAGTGKFTPYLLNTGASVLAVEPVAQMVAALTATVADVIAIAGTAESLPLADRSVDAVICAQSFHWFATPEALAEIHRILKPAGKLGLVWNLRDASVGWVDQLNQIVNRVEGDTPRYYTGAWRNAFPFHGFGPLHEQHFSHGHTGTPENVLLNRVRSMSFIAALAPDARAEIETQVSALIAAEPALSGKDVVTVPYETAAFYTQKIDM